MQMADWPEELLSHELCEEVVVAGAPVSFAAGSQHDAASSFAAGSQHQSSHLNAPAPNTHPALGASSHHGSVRDGAVAYSGGAAAGSQPGLARAPSGHKVGMGHQAPGKLSAALRGATSGRLAAALESAGVRAPSAQNSAPTCQLSGAGAEGELASPVTLSALENGGGVVPIAQAPGADVCVPSRANLGTRTVVQLGKEGGGTGGGVSRMPPRAPASVTPSGLSPQRPAAVPVSRVPSGHSQLTSGSLTSGPASGGFGAAGSGNPVSALLSQDSQASQTNGSRHSRSVHLLQGAAFGEQDVRSGVAQAGGGREGMGALSEGEHEGGRHTVLASAASALFEFHALEPQAGTLQVGCLCMKWVP